MFITLWLAQCGLCEKLVDCVSDQMLLALISLLLQTEPSLTSALLSSARDALCFFVFVGMQEWVTILIGAKIKASSFWPQPERVRMKKGQIHCRLTSTRMKINCFTCPKQQPVWIRSASCPYVFIHDNAKIILNSQAGPGWKEMLGVNGWSKLMMCVVQHFAVFLQYQDTYWIILVYAC